MDGSHAADLELARRCAAGESAAWDHFVREYWPVLYRAADALDPHGGAPEIADSLYAELYGLNSARRSLLLSFSGRSSLATWLRAVLCQRFVDRARAQRRLEPLPVDDPVVVREPVDPNRSRYVELVTQALGRAVGQLSSRDRLRLSYYYVQELTLARRRRDVADPGYRRERHARRRLVAIALGLLARGPGWPRVDHDRRRAVVASCAVSGGDRPPFRPRHQ